MHHEKSSLGSTFASVAAFFILALALGVATWWLYSILMVTHESVENLSDSVQYRASRATAGIGLLAVLTGLGTLFFAAVGAYTLWLGLTRFRKATPAPDTSWKDMPYPKG